MASDITALLGEIEGGNRTVVDRLLPHVYAELRSLASRQLNAERPDHTLNATALVHEAYFRLVRQEQVDWKGRAHFFGIAALAMRRILVNYAEKRRAEKRGGGAPVATFSEGDAAREARTEDLLAVDQALDALAARSQRQARIVELWFFGGLTQEEIAEVLGISVPTVRRDWRVARAYLSRVLSEAAVPPTASPGRP